MLCFCHFIFGATKITILTADKIGLKLQKLSLIFFKNHDNWNWRGGEDIIALAGLNGVGKTTILDAIHFLCLGKSYFSGTDIQCIQHDQPQAGIIADILDENVEMNNLKVKFTRGSRKKVERNGTIYKRIADHIGKFLAVVIAPGDIELIYGSNEVRRTFINQILGQIHKYHLEDLMKYNKLMEHRNKHLKEEMVDYALLQTLDEQIAPIAKRIYELRKEFLSKFSVVFADRYYQLAGKSESVTMVYKSQLEDNSYLKLVQDNRGKDLAVQRSFTGIHKDEIEINIGDVPLKKFGSQGQIKSSLIALKLASFSYLSDETDKIPILLLDDIFEKIDEERAQVLTQIIKNDNFGQIFITDTSVERLQSFCEEIGKPYTTITLD